jgi:signal transduction histidine kinase
VDVETARRLGRIIDERRSEIERRWLERVQRDVVGTQGVELTQLRDGMPHYLAAMVKLLKGADLALLDEKARTAWVDIAREHGITRVRIGFDISQLVHEFIVLRHVIGEIVDQEPPLLGAKQLLADIVEAAIAASVQAYGDARDLETRRSQAENIGFLTHELRNPLMSATLSAAKLRETAASPEQRRHAETLDRNLRKLGDLIDSVLLTQRLEAREVRVTPTDIELGPLLEGALEAARKVAHAKNLELREKYDPSIKLRVDAALTRSAIANLADNAVKYTDAGWIEIEVEDRPDEVVLNVRDTCHGISPEELRTIFEPFKRGRSGKAGTGLGLTIARHGVEAQGGSIRAESPNMIGCQFSITLPKRVV